MTEALALFFDKTKAPIKGIIHVGAHYGQEIPFYQNLGATKIIAYEPQDSCFNQLCQNFALKDGIDLRKRAVGNCCGEIEMNVESANYGQSSSILKPKKHLEQYPAIQFESTIKVPIVRLDGDIEEKEDFDVLVVDVQGYELEVFRGARQLLEENIKVIITEVNCDEVYENCAKVEELDKFLGEYGFVRALTNWSGDIWGDAMYVKR